MTIYYLQNANGEIIEDGFEKFSDDCLEKDLKDYRIQNGYNGALFFEEYIKTDEYKRKAAEFENRSKINDLRVRREEECFSVINRGALWYARLSKEQTKELNGWYQKWLDVTETLNIPDKPEWLKTV